MFRLSKYVHGINCLNKKSELINKYRQFNKHLSKKVKKKYCKLNVFIFCCISQHQFYIFLSGKSKVFLPEGCLSLREIQSNIITWTFLLTWVSRAAIYMGIIYR